MPKFDPYQRPMSLQESNDLLNGADDHDAAKLGMRSTFWEVVTLGAVLGLFGAVALALWLGSLVIGATAAGVIGLVGVMIWLGRRE